jgi:hypothetical protein
MKIRNGFISNSSSSSFVIAYKEDKTPCPHCKRVDSEIDSLKTVANNDEEGGWTDMGKEEILERLSEDIMCADNDEDEKKIIKKNENKISKLELEGYKFAEVSSSINNCSIENLIRKNKKIIIIIDGN